MDKRIENAMNEIINAEIWSCNLYLSLRIYFENQQLPVLASCLEMQSRSCMERIYCIMKKIYQHDGGVAIHGIAYKSEDWDTPMLALDRLTKNEQCISSCVSSVLALAYNVDMTFYVFIRQLYSHRIYMNNILLELLRVLAKEFRRRLPFIADVNLG